MSPFVSQCQNVTLLFRCTCILKSNFSLLVKTSHLVFRVFLDPRFSSYLCALIIVLKFRQETTRCKDSLSDLNLKVL